MRLGHGARVGRVRLGRLPLRLLIGGGPGVGHRRARGHRGLHSDGLHSDGLRDRLRDGLHSDGLHSDGLHSDGLHEGGLGDSGCGRVDRVGQSSLLDSFDGRRLEALGVGLGATGRAVLGRVRLAVVAAAQLHHHPRLRHVARIAGRLEGLPERADVHLRARRGQLAQRVVQAGDAVATLAIGGDGAMRATLQDATHEPRQHGARTDLHEGAHARGVHGLDLFDEAHGARDLIAEQRANRARVRRIGRGLAVGVDGELGRRDVHARQELAEGNGARADHFAVEGGGHPKAREAHALGVELLLEGGDGVGLAADDDLRGAVVVGEDHARGALGEQAAHDLGAGADGRHRARRARRFRHQLAATTGYTHRVLFTQDARGVERNHLAEAVASDRRRLEPDGAHQAQTRQAGHADAGLCPLGRGELRALRRQGLLFEGRLGEDHVVQRLGAEDVEVGGGVPGCARVVPVHRQVRAHVDELAALSGKEEGDVALDRAQTEGQTVRRLEGFALHHQARGLVELLRELGLVLGHQSQACVRLRVVALLRSASEVDERAGFGHLRAQFATA